MDSYSLLLKILNMNTIQTITFICLLVVQLIALYIMLEHASQKDSGILMAFSFIFFFGSMLVFLCLFQGFQVANEYNKQERMCPQYEEIEDPVYRLK